MKELKSIKIEVANEKHIKYAEIICATIEKSAAERGTGIAKRSLSVSFILSVTRCALLTIL